MDIRRKSDPNTGDTGVAFAPVFVRVSGPAQGRARPVFNERPDWLLEAHDVPEAALCYLGERPRWLLSGRQVCAAARRFLRLYHPEGARVEQGIASLTSGVNDREVVLVRDRERAFRQILLSALRLGLADKATFRKVLENRGDSDLERFIDHPGYGLNGSTPMWEHQHDMMLFLTRSLAHPWPGFTVCAPEAAGPAKEILSQIENPALLRRIVYSALFHRLASKQELVTGPDGKDPELKAWIDKLLDSADLHGPALPPDTARAVIKHFARMDPDKCMDAEADPNWRHSAGDNDKGQPGLRRFALVKNG